jgi:hypothetical protein
VTVSAGRDTVVVVTAAVLAVLVGAGAGFAPVPTLIGTGGVLVLVMALAAPRLTVGLTILVILFKRPVTHLVTASALTYIDTGFVALCLLTLPLRRLALRKPLRTFPGQWWFAAFFLAGILSGMALRVPTTIYLSGAFVIGKGILLAWAVAQVDWSERQLRAAARFGTVVILIALVATAANLAMPGAWNAVMSSDLNATAPRSFLPSLIGPFSHPIDLGQFMALSGVAIAAWRATVRKTGFTTALFVATVAGALLTARRTAAGGLSAAWLAVQATVRSTRVLVVMAVFLPLAALLLAQPVAEVVQATYKDYVANGTTEARTVLTRDSFSVAKAHFPAGAGFGRFGSAVAAQNYSPEYVQRGYMKIWGLGNKPEEGRFLTDTEWPAIIGETGYIGTAAYLVGLVAILRAGRRIARTARQPTHRWVGMTAMGWLIALLVQSVGTVSFTGPPVNGAFFAVVGVLAMAIEAERARAGPGPVGGTVDGLGSPAPGYPPGYPHSAVPATARPATGSPAPVPSGGG